MILKYECSNSEMEVEETEENQYDVWKAFSKATENMTPSGQFNLSGSKQLLEMLKELIQPLEYLAPIDSKASIERIPKKPVAEWKFVDLDSLLLFFKETFPPFSVAIQLFNTVTILQNGKRIQSKIIPDSNTIHLAAGFYSAGSSNYKKSRRDAVCRRLIHEFHAYFLSRTNYILDHSVKEFVRDNFQEFKRWETQNAIR